MEGLNVRLPVFEGPLDLLLHLIEKNKLDIYDIPILEITRQYLEYLKSWDEMNLEVASEFIVMAATLINIKARRLLPAAEEGDPEEEDEEALLIERLLRYRQFKEAAAAMRGRMNPSYQKVLERQSEPIHGERPLPSPEELLKEVSLQMLQELWLRAVQIQKESIDERRIGFRTVSKDSYSVSEKIEQLTKTLELFETVSFYDLRKQSRSKEEAITYFMAMLELSRMNQVVLTQTSLFGDITMQQKSKEEQAYGETLPPAGALDD